VVSGELLKSLGKLLKKKKNMGGDVNEWLRKDDDKYSQLLMEVL
jgi:hypothetical protein